MSAHYVGNLTEHTTPKDTLMGPIALDLATLLTTPGHHHPHCDSVEGTADGYGTIVYRADEQMLIIRKTTGLETWTLATGIATAPGKVENSDLTNLPTQPHTYGQLREIVACFLDVTGDGHRTDTPQGAKWARITNGTFLN